MNKHLKLRLALRRSDSQNLHEHHDPRPIFARAAGTNRLLMDGAYKFPKLAS